MVSVDKAYMIGHMRNANGSLNNKNVVLSAACEAAELFQCMMEININSAEVLYKQKEETTNE